VFFSCIRRTNHKECLNIIIETIKRNKLPSVSNNIHNVTCTVFQSEVSGHFRLIPVISKH
jgi:hypothetical protein